MGTASKMLVISVAIVLLVSHSGSGEACLGNGFCPPGQFCQKASDDCYGVGSCQPIPADCPAVESTVCGCDGVTYLNNCFAYRAGVNVAYSGECDCQSNDDCDPDEFCLAHVPGDCFSPGLCQIRPVFCMVDPDPVCGCDGTSYNNACYAQSDGINVDHDGNCTSTCTNNSDCGIGDYCKKETGSCRSIGFCQTMPTSCELIIFWMCGCDGVSYINSCSAARAGVNVLHSGMCGPACSDNSGCDPATQYCNKPTGDCAGAGTCVNKPDVGPAYYYPVCGCNDVTYFNASMAAGNSQAVAVDAPCLIFGDGLERGDTSQWSGP